eukprot:Tbor_TRINITY_DN1893_c0_g1::TRINITY_DN1893_c0_g1_i1::g.23038::m.23038
MVGRSDKKDCHRFDFSDQYNDSLTTVEAVNNILASVAAQAEIEGKQYIEENRRSILNQKSTIESSNWRDSYINPRPPEAAQKAISGRPPRSPCPPDSRPSSNQSTHNNENIPKYTMGRGTQCVSNRSSISVMNGRTSRIQ